MATEEDTFRMLKRITYLDMIEHLIEFRIAVGTDQLKGSEESIMKKYGWSAIDLKNAIDKQHTSRRQPKWVL